GRDLIRKDDPRLHRIELSEMLDRVGRPIARVKSRDRKCIRARIALTVEVVDREDRSRAAEVVASAQPGMEISRQQRSVPVVRVNDVRGDAEKSATIDDRTAEEREALQVVVESVEPRRVA